MAITTAERNQIIELTVLMFNAAPGAEYLSQIVALYEANPGTADQKLQALANQLATTSVYGSMHPNFETAEEFAADFLTPLGLQNDAVAKDFIIAKVNAGVSKGQIAYEAYVALNAVPADGAAQYVAANAILNNKTTVAEYYSVTADGRATDLATLQNVVGSVTSTQASVDAAIAEITGTSGGGQTFVLTTAANNLTGTVGNDTFVGEVNAATAAANTVGAADQIDGGAGTDTLEITISDITGATALPALSATNVERISIRNVDVTPDAITVDGTNFAGDTEFIADRSSGAIVFNNIGTSDLTIAGNDAVTNGNVTFNSSAAGSVTDALTINVKDGVTAGVVTSNSANDDWTAVTVNSTGVANALTSMALSGGATMQSLTVNATTDLSTGAITGWDTTGATTANKGMITVTGAGTVDLGALNGAVEDVVASGSSGSVRLTASGQVDFTFVGGSGNDRVTTNGALGDGGSVDAGAGTADRLTVATSTDITSTVGAKYTNFEVLQVQNGVSVDMDDVAGITSVRINGGAAATGVTDLSAAQAAAVTVVAAAAGVVTLGVKGATTVGQIDTVKITVDNGTSANVAQTLTAPVLTGVEKLEITAVDDVTITALTSATALDSIIASGSKAISITTGALATNVNTVVNASAMTGVFTFNAAAATTNPMAITGGSGNDVITTSAQADLVNGKAGIDSITITAGTADVQSDALVSADADLITGFVSGTNDYDYNGVLTNGGGAAPGIAATEVASAATFAAGLATGDAANDIVFIATTALAGGNGNVELGAAVAGGMTAAEATALEAALVGTGGALNGAIAGLDTVLSATDAVLLVMNDGANSVVLRVTNSDQTATNTLTAAEIEVVGVFAGTAALAAGDFI